LWKKETIFLALDLSAGGIAGRSFGFVQISEYIVFELYEDVGVHINSFY
jgi:hypothetical protein